MKWEYLTHTINLAQEPGNRPEHALNKLGSEGWEVIGFERDNARTDYLFKRPKRKRRTDG